MSTMFWRKQLHVPVVERGVLEDGKRHHRIIARRDHQRRHCDLLDILQCALRCVIICGTAEATMHGRKCVIEFQKTGYFLQF